MGCPCGALCTRAFGSLQTRRLSFTKPLAASSQATGVAAPTRGSRRAPCRHGGAEPCWRADSTACTASPPPATVGSGRDFLSRSWLTYPFHRGLGAPCSNAVELSRLAWLDAQLRGLDAGHGWDGGSSCSRKRGVGLREGIQGRGVQGAQEPAPRSRKEAMPHSCKPALRTVKRAQEKPLTHGAELRQAEKTPPFPPGPLAHARMSGVGPSCQRAPQRAVQEASLGACSGRPNRLTGSVAFQHFYRSIEHLSLRGSCKRGITSDTGPRGE